MPNRRARRAKEVKALKESALSPTSVLHFVNEQFAMDKEFVDTIVDSRPLLSAFSRARDSDAKEQPFDRCDFGLGHAIEVILGEREACNVARKVYEAGLLICLSVFVECSRDNGVFAKFMRHFEPYVGIAIANFSFRFNVVLRRANKITSVVPKRLSIDKLPVDAVEYWKTQRERVMRAIDCIDFDYVDNETAYVNDHHARCAVSVLASSGPVGRLCIIAECAVCYNSDMTQLRKCGDDCNYIVCNLCYDELYECPFCGLEWHQMHNTHI